MTEYPDRSESMVDAVIEKHGVTREAIKIVVDKFIDADERCNTMYDEWIIAIQKKDDFCS